MFASTRIIIIYKKYYLLSLQIFTCVLASMQTVCSIEDTFKVKIWSGTLQSLMVQAIFYLSTLYILSV